MKKIINNNLKNKNKLQIFQVIQTLQINRTNRINRINRTNRILKIKQYKILYSNNKKINSNRVINLDLNNLSFYKISKIQKQHNNSHCSYKTLKKIQI